MVDYVAQLPSFSDVDRTGAFLAGFGSLLAGFLAYISYSLFFHPLAGVPGPLLARMGLGWLTVRALKHDMGWKLQQQHMKNGALVRTARNEVSIVDPAAINEIYRYGGQFEKTRWVPPGVGESLVADALAESLPVPLTRPTASTPSSVSHLPPTSPFLH